MSAGIGPLTICARMSPPRWPRAWRNPGTLGLHEEAWEGMQYQTTQGKKPQSGICQFMLFGLPAAVTARPLLMPVIVACALHVPSIKARIDHLMSPQRCGDGVWPSTGETPSGGRFLAAIQTLTPFPRGPLLLLSFGPFHRKLMDKLFQMTCGYVSLS